MNNQHQIHQAHDLPNTVKIPKEEFQLYQRMLPDFVTLIIALQKIGKPFEGIMPTAQEAQTPIKMNMVSQMKVLSKIMPHINQFLPELMKELQGNVMPICKKYETLVQKYQQATNEQHT